MNADEYKFLWTWVFLGGIVAGLVFWAIGNIRENIRGALDEN